MTRLAFRNVDASPLDPVETWPQEGFRAAIERGYLADWARVANAVRAEPYGAAAANLADVLRYVDASPAAVLLAEILKKARAQADREDAQAVAADIRALVAGSGLTQTEFARRLGTSRTRLSTWVNGRVTPGSATLRRIRRLA
ncbi:MAG: helix-turn-helix domain-containing protein [Bifidobacteriaceae bacterium]|jgi:DNA-binding transcriptional regulator YiaG|nr:helix-turn-helix domain-containing protein [Bifidobacteriaceae bacterium]